MTVRDPNGNLTRGTWIVIILGMLTIGTSLFIYYASRVEEQQTRAIWRPEYTVDIADLKAEIILLRATQKESASDHSLRLREIEARLREIELQLVNNIGER